MSEHVSLHNHTVFCDGEDGVEAMCRAAFEEGLSAIGFSSHAPLGGTGMRAEWHLKSERFAEYAGEVLAARERWEGKIAVYLGLEVDYIRGVCSARDWESEDLRGGARLDYLIGSVHYVSPPRGASGGSLFPVFNVDGAPKKVEANIRASLGGDGEAMMRAYWDAVLEMVELGGFDVVGHLDLVKKNNAGGRWFDEGSEAYLRRAEEAARAIASAGLVVEANTGGMNSGLLREPYPSPSILRLLRKHGVPVAVSADAHRAGNVAGHYAEARRFLRDAGYSSHVVFRGRGAGGPAWAEQPL